MFKCHFPGCDNTYTRQANLRIHERTHTGSKPYTCTFPGCSSAYARRNGLTRHNRTHTGEKPYRCTFPLCSSAFADRTGLVNHERTHSGDKPFTCSYKGCPARFSQRSNLKTHENSHADHKPVRCRFPGCDLRFPNPSTEKVHYRVHSDERPYKCKHPGCIAAFKQASALRIHKGTHCEDGKPFSCPYPDCSFSSIVKTAVVVHTRVHTGERPYKCSHKDCPDTFTRLGHLKQHVKAVHDQVKDQVCDFPHCSYSTSRQCHLQRHWENWHSPEASQRRKIEEGKVEKYLIENGVDFDREHRVEFDCWDGTYARVDFLIVKEGCVYLLEVDEGQHAPYGVACDVVRMTNVHMSMAVEGNTLPLCFIRFNPHSFEVNGVERDASEDVRLAALTGFLNRPIEHIGVSGSLQIQYMYYNAHTVMGGVQLNIWKDPAYPDTVQQCCLLPVL